MRQYISYMYSWSKLNTLDIENVAACNCNNKQSCDDIKFITTESRYNYMFYRPM